MLPLYSAASSRLLVFVVNLFLAITVGAAPTPEPGPLGNLGAVFSKDVNLTEIINTGITTLAELLTALKSGETNQNGLWGIININNITSHLHDDDNANNRTSNFLSTIKGHTPHAVCPGVAVLFARGTKEPGNMGFLAGPPFVTALQHYANGSSLAVQGVDYPATARGFKAGGSPEGAETMAALANATREACPGAKVVLAGYSQGAQVVRRACGFLGDDAAGRLSSVVLFGDPGNGTAVPGVAADRIFTACHDGDAVCKGGSVVRPQHLNYSGDAPAAALFVMAKTGLGMGSGDAVLDGMGDIPMMNSTAQQGIGEMVVGDLGSDKGDSQGVLGLG